MWKSMQLTSIAFVLYSPFASVQPLPKSAREAGAHYAQALGAAETCGDQSALSEIGPKGSAIPNLEFGPAAKLGLNYSVHAQFSDLPRQTAPR